MRKKQNSIKRALTTLENEKILKNWAICISDQYLELDFKANSIIYLKDV
ncbi:MAG: hypothetical protein ACTSPL_04005 [Candidatus Odinarchaeia archaeon]